MSDTNAYRLSDDAIAQVAKLLQLAILTGTDVVDNLRILELVEDGGVLEPAPGFLERLNENISTMMEELEELTSEGQEPGEA